MTTARCPLITIVREYEPEPSRCVAALVQLLEMRETAGGKPAPTRAAVPSGSRTMSPAHTSPKHSRRETCGDHNQ